MTWLDKEVPLLYHRQEASVCIKYSESRNAHAPPEAQPRSPPELHGALLGLSRKCCKHTLGEDALCTH
eukprot:1141136-Pelagomonas_calceolata.AAC.1